MTRNNLFSNSKLQIKTIKTKNMSITSTRLSDCKPLTDSRRFNQDQLCIYSTTFCSYFRLIHDFWALFLCVIVRVWHVDRAESRSQWSARQGSGCTISEVPIWRGWPYQVYSLATGQPQTYWRLPRINPTTHWDKLPSLESRRCNKPNKEELLIQRFQIKGKI